MAGDAALYPPVGTWNISLPSLTRPCRHAAKIAVVGTGQQPVAHNHWRGFDLGARLELRFL
jgi:hypothetical protein